MITIAVDHGGDRGCRLGVGVLEQVAVAVLGEGRRRMTEPFGDLEGLLFRRDEVSDVRMPQVMESNSPEPEPGHPPVEHLGDRLRVKWTAGGVREDEVMVVRPAGADEQPVLDLAPALVAKHGDRCLVDID